ncbi:hypothetical protein M3221_13115 [Domibacillus indicus]|uniref:hypothetical protein n=1 Tax=Domibacillus indicus TaxID=1437523 RepID=UPI00203DCD78|nr:hypothetical protein [Domibacillus indicus]MCM3789340.1 hypothetical protein [Domibacillus indicus]
MRNHLFALYAYAVIIAFLAACASGENENADENLLFKGQGENWEAEVYTGKVIEPEVKGIEPYIYLKPRDVAFAEIKDIVYKLESDGGSFSGGDLSFNEQREISFKNEKITKTITSETEEVTLVLDWLEGRQQKTEVIILTKKN